ncbi:DNA polymerase I [Levilactobacillus acidifarinae]|uniref:DNA polymerase I n=1 Tax=Levilactobacillus acidifarinae DSM 19394 = JCM 15949 TaxID=1423715 RepID=A0A0R1LEP2_9LACO|nr:DNA polymerase I [Levilactobacillus acidifarinae]KRK94286.1 DNA polymerase I [Levilactobacillus acidifarinae DSM 19394]GEO69931.1 DNA polymerase [Levilactobacillus acidifarinae]
MAEKRLLLIDGNSVAFKAFFALYNSLSRFTNGEGLHTNAIYGFNTMLETMLDNVNPTHVLVAFDAGKVTFRTKMYDNYKGGRAKTAPELSEQFPYLRDLLTARGIKTYELPDYEADDIIGTTAKRAEKAGFTTTIVTGDRDLTQLADERTTVAISKKGVSEIERYTPAYVKEKLGVTPEQIIDIKGLRGDTSDNYPGVTGVGPKRAVDLIDKYGSVEGVYDHIDEITAKKLKEHLVEDHANAVLSKKLATINRDAPVDLTLDDLVYNGPDMDALVAFYQQMDFRKFLQGLSVDGETPSALPGLADIAYTELTADNLNSVQLDGECAFYLEMDGDNYHLAEFAGFVIGAQDHWWVSRDVRLLQQEPLKGYLEDAQRPKQVFDAKRTYVGLNRLNITLTGVDGDLLLASYLLNTYDNSNDLGRVAAEHGYDQVETDEDVYGRGAKRAIPDDDPVFFSHLARKARAIEHLKAQLFKDLETNDQVKLYREIELPMAFVLARMEIAGITVDAGELEAMGSKFSEQLAEIEQTIYNEAGEEFNIGSPKQLGHILFEKMGLPVIKKTKTGYSTAVGVLEKLAADAPIAENILKYRKIAKIQSTYVEGLLKVIHPDDHKVHTRYLQTLTQTGRLSSVDPNLQNIPVRSEEGKAIRKAFIPRHPGWQIFSSDYSQIELRVLAHMSHDANMQEAFREGQDIHAATARRIFKLGPDEEVTPNIRRQAKAVNFGIVYGISDFGLSQNIGIPRKQAKQFIDTYFEEYPGVKAYTERMVQLAHEQGYVETIAHRRRYLPDINSRNFNQRSFAERTAMNTPIQGSAADIIKIAMIRMEDAIKDLQATMLLQVHDELIFEAPAEEMATLEKLVPKIMDSAVPLEIPLKVDSHYGPTWYDVK